MEGDTVPYGDFPHVPSGAIGRPHPFIAASQDSRRPFTSKPELSGSSNVADEIARIFSHT